VSVVRTDRRTIRRRRLLAAAAVLFGLAIVAAAVAVSGGRDSPSPELVPRDEPVELDPLAYEDSQDSELAEAATFALAQPLYAKSPGGVVASARRTDAFRDLVEDAVAGSGLDADEVEAIVFLESAGRPDVIAGDDPARASGLTQILAETAVSFLGMKVDLEGSRRLTARVRAATRRGDAAAAARLREARRRIDERFEPSLALAGTVRYLTTARERLGRDDLAVVSYHMGIGNLSNVVQAYVGGDPESSIPELVDDNDLSWARLFFDTTPDRHTEAHELLSRLGDDSPTYYWRVQAAKEIMRLYRRDRDRLVELAALYGAKASAEEVLHPREETDRFTDPGELEAAWQEHAISALPDDPVRYGFAVSETMGEHAPRLGLRRELYQGLRPEALALLLYLADRVRAHSGAARPLEVTSAVRDDAYQALLRTRNAEATARYSLHTTGFAFDVRRRYESNAQARAFQFHLDDLTARGLIAWVREPAAIHVTVSSEANRLVGNYLEAR
jgi:hypothetical protein